MYHTLDIILQSVSVTCHAMGTAAKTITSVFMRAAAGDQGNGQNIKRETNASSTDGVSFLIALTCPKQRRPPMECIPTGNHTYKFLV